MNNNNPSQPQQDRLNHLIDVLLTENACLKQIVTALLPGGKGLSETEVIFARSLTSNYESEDSRHQLLAGNNEMNISNQQFMDGNKEMIVSNHNITPGNNQSQDSNYQLVSGNYQLKNSYQEVMTGNNGGTAAGYQVVQGTYEQQLSIVQENVRSLMKTAILSSHLATSRMLIQISLNPATPLAELRKLTGLSEDGMAKRIMAMKKAGLIVKLSTPKRFLLTEKAKGLFIKIWR